MNTKNTMKVISLVLIGILMYSCHNDEDFIENMESKTKETESTYSFGEKIILGKQLENPYTIQVMKEAWLNIQKNSNAYRLKSNLKIKFDPTHKYIKFIPKDSDELNIIERDTTIIAYDYPLDYEILQMGDYYHDPEVPKDRPTYHYACLDIEQTVPRGIDYEVISDELFIPNIETFGEELYDLLTDEALRLTNNLENENAENTDRRRKWRPAGTIKVWDDNIGETTSTVRVFSHWEYYDCDEDGNNVVQKDNPPKIIEQCRRAVYTYTTVTTPGSYVPMQGVKVRARRWFTTHTGITNAQGYYSCNGRFRRPANYKIKWKRHDFTIRWSAMSSAKYNGPKKRGDWNLNIRGGTQEYYATIFRAAHHYYYQDIKGLRRPPQNSTWRIQVKIRAFKEHISEDGNLGTHEANWRAFGINSRIKMYTYGAPAIETYSTTIHELAHASHWNMGYDFYQTESIVKESWARGVEWDLTRMIYPDYEPWYCNSLCVEPSSRSYTGVVQDLIDDDNRFGNTSLLGEEVTGYSIRQIEDALRYRRTWDTWRNNILNGYNNDTEDNLEALFDYWN